MGDHVNSTSVKSNVMLFNTEHVFDVVIIGGGINGCGCAADAAMRGLSVLLCEQDDLASKTSSNSSKLIHGGLRYLEHFDFALVKKALDERQRLLGLAPHLIQPLSFVLPYQKQRRPLWMLRIGMFLYDHLSQTNRLPHSQLIKRDKQGKYFTPLVDSLMKGFLFYDCATDDARLTITNALQAKNHGANILPHTKLIAAQVVNGLWHLSLQTHGADPIQIKAKSVINAAGPWIETVNQLLKVPLNQHKLSLVKGSHLLVPKLYEGEHAYMLQHPDKRVVFAIPYHGYTMIGTTELVYAEAKYPLSIEKSEIDYLLNLINLYFNKPLQANDVVHSWSGIRPLLSTHGKSASALSRDFALQFSMQPAPAVTIYGGKITTYRQLSLQTVNQLRKVFPQLSESVTDKIPLPGANLDNMDFAEYQHYAHETYHWLDKATRTRYLHSYGTRTELVLAGCQQLTDLGICFTDTLYQAEVDYLRREEWAISCEDILWRRSKLGLRIDETGRNRLAEYLLKTDFTPHTG